jgi:hypothetical protein
MADSVQAGRLILVNALDRHSQDAGLHFSLSCYESCLGNKEKAKEYLARCFELDSSWRITALG